MFWNITEPMLLERNFASSNAFYITIKILEVNKSQAFKATFSIFFSLATYILPLVQLQQLSLHNYTCLLSIATALMWPSTVSHWDYHNSLPTKPPILCLSQIQPILWNWTRFIFQKVSSNHIACLSKNLHWLLIHCSLCKNYILRLIQKIYSKRLKTPKKKTQKTEDLKKKQNYLNEYC